MPVFNDSESIPQTVPNGDYIVRVEAIDYGISAGGKTSGSPIYKLKLRVEPFGCLVWEHLIDHELTGWKIDTFLKSCGVKIAKGDAFEFDKADAEKHKRTWVNVVGLRGWATLSTETYNDKQRNKVAVWITTKEKLPRYDDPRDAQEDACPF